MWASQILPVIAALSLDEAATPAQDPHRQHAATQAMMTGALGSYPMTRDTSGTSWQPDSTPHEMAHVMRGEWMLSGHASLNLVHDEQRGPRGDQREFAAGMFMGQARRDFAAGDALTLRAMLSPDPLMGKRGYPLLLAAGETADGETPLVDRQHPHELVMELSATWSAPLGERTSGFVYAALPGEPAFGPPSFMHRSAAMSSPEAPITHHWLDSTHITFGVLTAGAVWDAWKLEASRFTGREPDEDRYDIERPRMDSTAIRASWNPTRHWSLQVSWADLESPEQLEPEIDENRLSASASFTVNAGDGRWSAATLSWGRKEPDGHDTMDAVALEAAWAPVRHWLLFARAEAIETHELSPGEEIFEVGKVSLGAMREFVVAGKIRLGLGALYSLIEVDDALVASYGDSPDGTMVFVRIAAGH